MASQLPSKSKRRIDGREIMKGQTKSAPRHANVRGHGIGTEVRMQSKPTVRLRRGHYSNYFTDDGYVVFPVHERLHRGGQGKRRSGWLVQFELTLTVQDDCPTLADARAAIAAHRARTFCRLCGTRVTVENRGAHTDTTAECSDCTRKVLTASTGRGWLHV